jgi:hypothetical protein
VNIVVSRTAGFPAAGRYRRPCCHAICGVNFSTGVPLLAGFDRERPEDRDRTIRTIGQISRSDRGRLQQIVEGGGIRLRQRIGSFKGSP